MRPRDQGLSHALVVGHVDVVHVLRGAAELQLQEGLVARVAAADDEQVARSVLQLQSVEHRLRRSSFEVDRLAGARHDLQIEERPLPKRKR